MKADWSRTRPPRIILILVSLTMGVTLFIANQHATNAQFRGLGKGTLSLFGRFAEGVAVAVAAEKANAYLRPEQKKPDGERPSRREEPKKKQLQGYEFTLQWQGHDGTYLANLVMHGTSGQLRVHSPRGLVIDQDVLAESSGSDVLLVGKNPRQPGSPTRLHNYSPDTFRLIQIANELWTIADMCDAQFCAPVEVLKGRSF